MFVLGDQNTCNPKDRAKQTTVQISTETREKNINLHAWGSVKTLYLLAAWAEDTLPVAVWGQTAVITVSYAI